jgi:excinuclease ABC subunit C
MNLANLPQRPGVYLLKKDKQVIYVGKALNLRDRVKTHLKTNNPLSPRASQMREQVNDVDFIPVRSDFEALLLEINLIKKHTPLYNVKLKDDKDYLYLKITDEDFPRVLSVRKRDLEGSLYYLGPFPNATIVRRTLRSLRRLFPYCSEKRKTGKPCFYFHLGLCSGACTLTVSQRDYKRMIKRMIDFLEGKTQKVLTSWQKEMETLSKNQQFEQAASVRDRLSGVNYLLQENRASDYMTKPDLLEDIMEQEQTELQNLLGVSTSIIRIECYDISNTQGSYSVGSMVVFSGGQPDKSQYRRFRIKKTPGINDYASLQEVLRRRFHNSWQLPDLIVVDGGKGQLHAAVEVKQELRIKIPFISLAKREEEIYTDTGVKLTLKRTNPALQLIQRLRDEAHRFAITYHRKLRSDALIKL